MKNKQLLISLVVAFVIATGVIIALVIYDNNNTNTTKTSTHTNTTNTSDSIGGGPLISFADCLAFGNTVTESYPRQCTTTDGEAFTEDIGNELDKANLIISTTPRPNGILTSPVTITGQARGQWFFEGEFPIFLYDIENNLIGQGSATADGDWMTEEFVDYNATLTFTEPAYGPGKLYLNNNNVSDNPELDDALIMPVDFPLQ
ncbi:MAG: Gmad2 immunoglobulin-like domain-containing protein [bacterium]|nr:Gmad2 immunoglobulin-like domain-containing protein [bacterium]